MAKITPESITRRFNGAVIVAASGPSLEATAEQCRALPVVAVNDAWRLVTWASVLYAADLRWWEHHRGCPKFGGDRFIPHTTSVKSRPGVAQGYRLHVIEGIGADGFSTDQRHIHYGGVLGSGLSNSGFQAVNLTLLMGGNPIILVGFDMREVNGKKHFFGSHPPGLIPKQNFKGWRIAFKRAAERLPAGVRIINATPGSALECFPTMSVKEAVDGFEADRAA